MKNGITVTASGEATATPDRAVLNLGASLIRADPQTALAAVSERIEALLAKLTEAGIEASSVQTSDLSLWPETDRQGAAAGYRARNGIRVRVDDVGRTGAILSSSLSVLSDAAELNGINFEVRDSDTAATEARAAAWSRALTKAEELARLAGVELGRPVSIEESIGGQPPRPMARLAMAAESVPVETGTNSVRVTLTVRFALVG